MISDRVANPVSFSARVIAWQKMHGRHDLPWQRPRDPYRIWLSEIMLQQTQVATVIPYYERFIVRFANVNALAEAPIEAVMSAWAGLGYYSRARNLHRCAKQVVAMHGGEFPSTVEALVQLPGIGRSTAAAIAALAFGERAAILDGNVKRVLARHFGIEGYPGSPSVARTLWQCAEGLLPANGQIGAYTQAMMDLGATICTRSRPQCTPCPISETCVARRERTIDTLPAARQRRQRPIRAGTVLVLRDLDGAYLLQPRPPAGIWGGLLSLPEFEADASDGSIVAEFRTRYGFQITMQDAFGEIRHDFTHFTYVMRPRLAQVTHLSGAASSSLHSVSESEFHTAPLPAPIRRLLLRLTEPALV